MSDQHCPNCGLWNSPGATVCDCGFNFVTGVVEGADASHHPSVASTLVKAALYGGLGSFLAIFPVSLGKTILYWNGICGHPPPYDPLKPVYLGRCGITLDSLRYTPLLQYILLTLLIGAFLGALMAFVLMVPTAAKSPQPASRKPASIFWPAFSIGFLFVVLFVFILLYPGQ